MRTGLSVRDSALAFVCLLLPAVTVWFLSGDPTGNIRGLAIGVVLASAGAGIAALASRRVSRRLEFFTEVVTHLAGPGQEVRVPTDGPSTLHELARALNRLSHDIQIERGRHSDAERRYRTLIETMSEGFVIVDTKESIVYANRRFADMLGVSVDDLPGRRIHDFLDDSNRKRLSQQSGARKQGKPGRYELDWVRADDTVLTTLVCAAALHNGDGDFTGSFAVITDITDRRRLEEQMSRAERLRALGQLAGGIAHDFNNRLTAILGNAQLLLLDASEEPLVNALTTIERAALDGAETVRRIMEFTRTRPDAAVESIETESLLTEVMGLLRFRWKDEADEGGHSYRILTDHHATRNVSGYPTEHREALLNVLNNAFDAMPEGGELRITTFDHPEGIGVRIADSGHGMSRRTLDRICDPFYTTRGLNATGLGLSITYGIVSRHGGNLSIQSAEGRGTTVTMQLPAAEATTPERPVDVIAGPREDRARGRILVVEDEAGIARLIQMTLSRSGHRVEIAESGEEAIERLRSGGRFDVVVTDLGMPGVPGYRVAEEASRHQPDAKVVVVTGWGAEMEETLEQITAVDLVVRKPFSVSDLVAKIEGVLGYDFDGRSGLGDRGGAAVEESPGTAGLGGG